MSITSGRGWEIICSAAASTSSEPGGVFMSRAPGRPVPFTQLTEDAGCDVPARADPIVACPAQDDLRGLGMSCSSDLRQMASTCHTSCQTLFGWDDGVCSLTPVSDDNVCRKPLCFCLHEVCAGLSQNSEHVRSVAPVAVSFQQP